MYDPETMPIELLQAHQDNDRFIDEHLYGRDFNDDTQRLQRLFALYETVKDSKPLTIFSEGAAANA
jgi:hypothetical protein